MFAEVRTRWQKADSEIRYRFQRRLSNEPQVTQSEVSELSNTVTALRKQLHQIVDNEIPANNEACGVAINGMIMLRNELDKKRAERDMLRDAADEAADELDCIEETCKSEKETCEARREDVTSMQADNKKARQDIINLRAEMEQVTYFQETVDTETKYRLRADLQNLEIEQERDQIRVRQVKTERDGLHSELEKLTKERDALQFISNERYKELSEVKMTREMYQYRHEILRNHLQSLGGDPNNIFENVGGFFKGWRRRALVDGGASKAGCGRLPSIISGSQRALIVATTPGADSERLMNNQGQQEQHAITTKQLISEKQKLQDISDTSRHISIKSKHSHAHVGGIIIGPDTVSGKSDILRKLPPTIFKLGEESNNKNSNVTSTQEYINKKEREIEFSPDSNSMSDISQITCYEVTGNDR